MNIPEREIEWSFSPAGGPGGQHANRASTRAELRFDVAGSDTLSEVVKDRVIDRLGTEIRIVEDGSKSQSLNRKRALRRLEAMLDEASKPPPPPRKKTKPSRAARQRRLYDKRRRSETKRLRQKPH